MYCNEFVNNSVALYCSSEHNLLSVELDKAFIAVTTDEVPKTNATAKKLVRFLHGSSCSMPDCGIDSWKGGDVPLVLDHIDGNSYNHVLSNLRLVCGNCDMLLPTYKAKNKGNGRHSRRLRYQSGQSY